MSAVALAVAVLSFAGAVSVASRAGASQTGSAPTITAQSILSLGPVSIDPATPAVDTLCKLAVEVRNNGDKIASAFDFDVQINGDSIEVYRAELFYDPVAPGETRMLELHNFWTTETHRPAPKDGRMKVEVILEQAQWMALETTEEEGQKVETWTPLGPALDQPQRAEIVVALTEKK